MNGPNPPQQGSVYVEQPCAVFMVQDDYLYYPQYEVYYSNSRRQSILAALTPMQPPDPKSEVSPKDLHP